MARLKERDRDSGRASATSPSPLPRFIRIEAPHFTGHADIESNRVSTHPFGVAPIIKYMAGWTGKRVKEYCREKGWKLTLYEASHDPDGTAKARRIR